MEHEEKELQGGPFEEQKLFLGLVNDLKTFILEYEKTTFSMRRSWDSFLGQHTICRLEDMEAPDDGEWHELKHKILILQKILETQRKIAKDMESFF